MIKSKVCAYLNLDQPLILRLFTFKDNKAIRGAIDHACVDL